MKTVLETVEDLNEDIKVDNGWFTYTLDGYVEAVSFNLFGENFNIKIDLWNSENSQQIYREETDDYEPLKDTIQRELAIALEHLKSFSNFADKD